MAIGLKPLTYAHLHAYVDKDLIEQRRVDVTLYVKTHPDKLICIRDYQFINKQLHKLLDGVLSEPVPERLLNILTSNQTKFKRKRCNVKRLWKNKILIVLLIVTISCGISAALVHGTHELTLLAETLYKIKTVFSHII